MIIFLRLLGLVFLLGGVIGFGYMLICAIKSIHDMDKDWYPAFVLFIVMLLLGILFCIFTGTFLMFVKVN